VDLVYLDGMAMDEEVKGIVHLLARIRGCGDKIKMSHRDRRVRQ